MPLEYSFCCPLLNGLHARPASHLAELVARFESVVQLSNERTGTTANAASVLELVSAGMMRGDPCVLHIAGGDEQAALTAIADFIEQRLAGCDEPLPVVIAPGPAHVPRLLSMEAVTCITGTTVSRGIGIGKIVYIGSLLLPEMLRELRAADPAAELLRVREAMAAVIASFEAQLSRAANPTAAEILRATLALAKDAALSELLAELLQTSPRTAEQAVVTAIEQFSVRLRATGSIYLRERVVDLQDIGAQLLEHLTGGIVFQPAPALTVPAVVSASTLSPRQLLALDRKYLRGLILTDAGTTSHAVILACSFGIPTITNAAGAYTLQPEQEVVVDANRGLVITPVTPAVRRFYDREAEQQRRRLARLAVNAQMLAHTKDGKRIEVSANIATDAQALPALAAGAEGVGLFRTEVIFSSSQAAPTEEEQFAIYRSAAEALAGRTLIIRTIDVGGDKPLPYLNLPREENPFLGYRGLRIYQDHANLITSQLRAIVRASAFGTVWIMAPMVSTVEEASWFKQRVAEVQAGLGAEGVAFDATLPVGIMLEVPSAALIIDQLSAYADFFSIGTNDLCQYFFAADRGNPAVAGLASVRHPAFLRLLKTIASAAQSNGRWLGICGEMAGYLDNTPLLVGLGLNELSLNASNISQLKSALALLDTSACQSLLEAALVCESTAEVDSLLAGLRAAQASQPLIRTELIRFDADCLSKAEVINELAGMLHAAGRTDAPDLVEDALWAREEAFSTGLGFGFAIPHCQTDNISANTLGVVKLAQPVAWGAVDDQPVEFVILLAIRESDTSNTHLRIFAKLARKLMAEEFRKAIAAARNPAEIRDCLVQELELYQEEV